MQLRARRRVDPGRLPTGVATLAYTYGEGFFAIALFVWIVVWLFVAVGVIRRRDLGIVYFETIENIYF